MVLGTTSVFINEKLWISEPLAGMLVGIARGPVGLGLMNLDVTGNVTTHTVLREAARVTLATSVAGAAMRMLASWLQAQ